MIGGAVEGFHRFAADIDSRYSSAAIRHTVGNKLAVGRFRQHFGG
jgi:hypothetical protein